LLVDVLWYKNGTLKPGNRLLPIEHSSVVWLADKGHMARQFASKLVTLCRQKKVESEGTPMDAKSLKSNLSYANQS
jgi:hypothetical protein